MKRVKKTPSRRTVALRRFAVAALLFCLIPIFRQYGFTKDQALRVAEDREGTGRTEIVRTMRRPSFKPKRGPMLLSANENAALLTLLTFHRKTGWDEGGPVALDCSGEEPIHMARGFLHQEPGYSMERLCYVFGRVDDPDIQEISLTLEAVSETGETQPVPQVIGSLTTSREDWFSRDGHTWFVMSYQCVLPANNWSVDCQAEVRTADGERQTYDLQENYFF